MKNLFFLIMILGSISAAGQQFRATIAPTRCSIYLNFADDDVFENPKYGFDVSLDYVCFKKSKYSFGFGLSYQNAQIEMEPIGPDTEEGPHVETVNLLSGNFKIIRDFSKGFYASVNPLLDFQLPSHTQDWIENQTGLGLSLNIGKSIPINTNLSMIIEPMIVFHNIIPFVKESRYVRRLNVIGIKVGIGF